VPLASPPHSNRIYEKSFNHRRNRCNRRKRYQEDSGTRKKITYVPVEIEAFSEIWKEMGYSPYIRQHISAVAQDCRDGVFSGTNDLVEKLTGQEPMQMVDYIVKNKALFV
jgi:hypothetical protein